MQKPIPDVRNGSGTNASRCGGVMSSSRGDIQQTEDLEPQMMGAVSLPLPCPALVHGQKAVEAAKSDGKWPVVDLSVDKYAILSNNGTYPSFIVSAVSCIIVYSNVLYKHTYIIVCILVYIVNDLSLHEYTYYTYYVHSSVQHIIIIIY